MKESEGSTQVLASAGAVAAMIVCLPMAQMLLGVHSEHRRIRFAYWRLGHLFWVPARPAWPSQKAGAAWAIHGCNVWRHQFTQH